MDTRKTWIPSARDGRPYGIDHLPLGVAIIVGSDRGRPVTRIGDFVVDLSGATAALAPEVADLFRGSTLNRLLAAGPTRWRQARAQVQSWLTDERHRRALEPFLVPVEGLAMVMPIDIGDFVDFYASEEHASNVGRLFRPGAPPLPDNWKHLPIAYHGRSGTVVVSGTSIRRPRGQRRATDGTVSFGATERLDFEAEVGFVVGVGTQLGCPVPARAFRDHVFGVCLVNDWSARDIQAWEYVPLGPFLGKSFATSMSAWITPLDALGAAWRPSPPRTQALLPYLEEPHEANALDLELAVRFNGDLISSPPFAGMYWTPAQMLAHLTANGASVRPGDLYASGTVSGPGREQLGSLLELTRNGREPFRLGDGSQRRFLLDGDEIVISATAPGVEGRLELGEVRGRITGPLATEEQS